jgi:predicted alpha/beta hydrolase family esterase
MRLINEPRKLYLTELIRNMKKKVLISYIWQDRSDEKWLFWLKKLLESKNFEVTFSELPKDVVKASNQSTWIANLQKIHNISGENTHFVAHDPGCLTILNYLEYLDKHNKADPTLLVAGFPKNPYTHSNPDLKRLETSKAPVMTSQSQELQLGELNVKLVVIYGGIIADQKPKEIIEERKGVLGYLKDKLGR